MTNIDLKDYILVRPDYIVSKKSKTEEYFYDIEVEDDHSFYIFSENMETLVLSHNCDGFHIMSLLINLFYLWFPWMISQGRIQFLETPLVTVGDKNKKYYYSLDEFKQSTSKSERGTIRYLKGLGSLSLDDWDYVMKNKKITILVEDKKTKYHLDMAFGKSAMERKKWLSSTV